MPISVNSISPVSAAAPAPDSLSPTIVLQPGSVVSAQVVGVAPDNLVRIAIAGLTMDVLSEVALAPGQNLQLAVSQDEARIRLSVVDDAADLIADRVTLTPGAAASNRTPSPAAAAAIPRNPLTPLEQIAVSLASADAATRQGSQAQLFADLATIVTRSDWPDRLKQAALNVLAQQTPLTSGITGGDIADAFQTSGLFLEQKLASGAPIAPAGVPDLKGALLVLRQTLTATAATFEPSNPDGPSSAPVQPSSLSAPAITRPSALSASAAGAPSPVEVVSRMDPVMLSSAPAAPETASGRVAESVGRGATEPAVPFRPAGAGSVPEAPAVAADQPTAPPRVVADVSVAVSQQPAKPTRVQAAAAESVLSLLQEPAESTAPGAPRVGGTAKSGTVDVHAAGPLPRVAPTPPPFRGGLPSAQAEAMPSLLPAAPLGQTVRHLLEETDAAIARQTLLQIASLPDRADHGGPRSDSAASQWNFEIPFATPQGAAVAQFEISRDGGGVDTEPAAKAWRVRFCLNVEPAGPVHALITLNGDKTFVRMWAERPATARRLQDGVAELSDALLKADLRPGDIVIRDGAPPQPAAPRAGHFVDRAT